MTQVVQNQKIKLMWIIFPLIFLFACTNNDVYIKYQSIPLKGWNKDSICSFNIPVNNVSTSYNIYINIRNRGEYPHQNLWLFIRQTTLDSVITNDTINFYLADQRGKWLGSGVGLGVGLGDISGSGEIEGVRVGSGEFDGLGLVSGDCDGEGRGLSD